MHAIFALQPTPLTESLLARKPCGRGLQHDVPRFEDTPLTYSSWRKNALDPSELPVPKASNACCQNSLPKQRANHCSGQQNPVINSKVEALHAKHSLMTRA